MGCGERPQEAGADRRADRILSGAQGQGLRLSILGLDGLQGHGQLLGTGDDAQSQFQLVKHYPSGERDRGAYHHQAVAGTVRSTSTTLSNSRAGRSTRRPGSSPSARRRRSGVEVTAGFEFAVPVRFDTDHMAVTIESYRLHAWQQIPIVELEELILQLGSASEELAPLSRSRDHFGGKATKPRRSNIPLGC